MKKKLLTTLAVAVCAIALVVGSIAGTVAYLTVRVSVTNTFSHGKVTITMDERRVDKNGNPLGNENDRITGNEYMLMPGTTYTKDPIIHIGADSQPTYLFLKVDNGIAGLAMTPTDQTEINSKRPTEKQVSTIHKQLLDNGWKVYVENATDDDPDNDVEYKNTIHIDSDGFDIVTTSTVYYYSVGPDEEDTDALVIGPHVSTDAEGKETRTQRDIPTIEYFTVGIAGVNQTSMGAYVRKDVTIVLTAYAVQGEGDAINSLDEAANIFKSEFTSAIPSSN